MVSCHLSRTSTVAAFHHGFCFKGMNAFDEYASQKVSIHILYYDIYLKLSIFTLVFQRLLLIFIVGAAWDIGQFHTICISQIATKCTCPFLDKTLWLDLFICDIVYSFWTTKDFFVQTGSFDPFFRPPPAGYAGEIFCSFFDRSIYILFMYMKGKTLRKKKMSKNLKKTCSNVRYMKFVPYGMYWKSSLKMLPKCGNYVRRWYVTGHAHACPIKE